MKKYVIITGEWRNGRTGNKEIQHGIVGRYGEEEKVNGNGKKLRRRKFTYKATPNIKIIIDYIAVIKKKQDQK